MSTGEGQDGSIPMAMRMGGMVNIDGSNNPTNMGMPGNMAGIGITNGMMPGMNMGNMGGMTQAQMQEMQQRKNELAKQHAMRLQQQQN